MPTASLIATHERLLTLYGQDAVYYRAGAAPAVMKVGKRQPVARQESLQGDTGQIDGWWVISATRLAAAGIDAPPRAGDKIKVFGETYTVEDLIDPLFAGNAQLGWRVRAKG